MVNERKHLFYQLRWRDPLSGQPLQVRSLCDSPRGLPLFGSLVIEGTNQGYPIVDGVVMATVQLAQKHQDWLTKQGLVVPTALPDTFQHLDSVESFGFQWGWASAPRTDADLQWRVATRFGLDENSYRGSVVLDAGAGAGDQSRWLLDAGTAGVVSIDLSDAIRVTSSKLRERPNWVGVQGDLTMPPFDRDTFDFVYCEGVIQHTRDSAATVRELCRMLKPGGLLSATHYGVVGDLEAGGIKNTVRAAIDRTVFRNRRERLSKWSRDRLLLYTGMLAWLSERPALGYLMRRSGAVIYNPKMLDFKSTWVCTYDFYGNHWYQREIRSQTFLDYFAASGSSMACRFQDGNVVLMQKA